VTIDYAWDAARKVQSVSVKQTQPGQAYRLPVTLDYYVNGKVQHQPVVMTEASQTFTMPLSCKPELVNVDASKKTLWQKIDNKPVSEYVYQYKRAPLFVDRVEALAAAAQEQTTNAAARGILLAALNDKFYTLRATALEALKLDNKGVAKAAAPALRKRASIEKEPVVLAQLLTALGQLKDKKDVKFFTQQLNSQSYNVQGAALRALATVEPAQALSRAKAYENDSHGALAQAVTEVYAKNGTLAQWSYVRDKFDAARPQGKFDLMGPLATMLGRLEDPTAFAEGVARLRDLGVKYKSYGADKPVIGLLQGLVPAKAGRADAANAQQAVQKAVADIEAAK
jgi:aminopeptidase N